MLLQQGTKTEQIKNCRIKWIQNFGENISMTQWENLWTKGIKFTECQTLRENWCKMFYRWYITPKDIAKANKEQNVKWEELEMSGHRCNILSYVVDIRKQESIGLRYMKKQKKS